MTQEDIDAGGIQNIAQIDAESITDGSPIADISADDDPGDGNPPIDPTVLTIPPSPALDVTKTVVSLAENAGEVVEFQIRVENTGNVTLSAPSLTDTMTNLDGDPLTPDSIAFNGTDEAVLDAGEVSTYTVLYAVTQADVDSGGVSNQALYTLSTPSGGVLSDLSDDGDDTDGDTDGDPTIAAIAANPANTLVKTAGNPVLVDVDVIEMTFTLTIENTGNLTLTDLVLLDDLTLFAGGATVLGGGDAPSVTATGFASGGVNAGYNGVSDTNLLAPSTDLPVGDTATVTLVARFSVADSGFDGRNEAELTSTQIASPSSSASTTPSAPAGTTDIVATKSAAPDTLSVGQTTTFTLTFTNPGATAFGSLTLVDQLPAGLVYTPGTAIFDGAATPPPDVAGRQLIWSNVTILPGQTITISLQARATGDPGDLTNRAWAQTATGTRISNIATVTVRIRPEHIFDCSDVIGKVYHDRNRNGIQDPPLVAGIIDDDRRATGKHGVMSEMTDAIIEEGIASARVVTTRGTIITTDRHGRFHVPCAELPGDIGTNFTLKLDPRSLPKGFRVVTENPRVIRLTAGKMAKLNFGVALSRVIDIDLSGQSFAFGAPRPGVALERALAGLVPVLKQAPSIVRLTYLVEREGDRLARARLDAVERYLTEALGPGIPHEPVFERTVVSARGARQ